MSSNTFSAAQVAQHNKAGDAWIIIDGTIYDISKFAALHPGGELLLLAYAGKDATSEFFALHRTDVLRSHGSRLVIGTVEGAKADTILKASAPGAISRVPFAESSFWQGYKSPYYNESHVRFRKAVRTFIQSKCEPEAAISEDSGKTPSAKLYKEMGEFGLLAARVGPGPHLKYFSQFIKELPAGVKPEEFDYFHELIAHEESVRMGYPGFQDGIGAGFYIGLPPIMHFAKQGIKEKVLKECLLGEKKICLAISEPTAGSDVAAIQATAVKSTCGKYYIVNGIKKWITNGTFADYFSTAVRTGGPGMGGISMLLIERGEGVETKPIKTSYSAAAGTALIIFENVKVPVENLLGKENEGFKVIMYNFNHERWGIVAFVVSGMRSVVEECFKWAHQREVFGKPLIEQPVTRLKLANMVARVESIQNWLENLTYQMCQMSYQEQAVKLAGPIALCKFLCTRASMDVSDDACQIFGGRAITRSGMGRKIEAVQRTVKFGAILGGSEEIMADLGIRQAMRMMPKNAKL